MSVSTERSPSAAVDEYIASLRRKACELRLDVVDMISNSDIRSGHFGGSMSAAEIVTVLYWHVMRVDPKNPGWKDRDRLVLSKGHAVPVVYAALAHKGFFDRGILRSYRQKGSILQGHPDCLKTPGLDTSSGSLGQGLSLALGMALGARHFGASYEVYALLSDGETQEGMVWEAAMAAAHHKVTNLTAVVDNNGLQVDGPVHEIMNIEPLEDKFRAFGWNCITVDGHDVPSLLAAFEVRRAKRDRPFAIIAKTVKGKGVSFMENDIKWHCCGIDEKLCREAMAELEKIKASTN
jgi:transketolase